MDGGVPSTALLLFPLMTLVLTRCSRTPDSLSCNDRSHQRDYSTVLCLLFSEMLRFHGLKPEEHAGEPCARVRLFRKPVPAGCEALFEGDSSFSRDKK